MTDSSGKPRPAAHTSASRERRLHDLITRIDALLPQTQCRQCGFEGCEPYAVAIAQGKAEINQCPPGGEPGIRALSSLLDRPYLPLNPAHGMPKAKAVAIIDEQHCIGCTLCIAACPVDAIVGASRHMHSVITQACTGCELCLPPCPVDCIQMQPVPGRSHAMNPAESAQARQRYQQRQRRMALEKERASRTYVTHTPADGSQLPEAAAAGPGSAHIKQAALAAALARAKARSTR